MKTKAARVLGAVGLGGIVLCLSFLLWKQWRHEAATTGTGDFGPGHSVASQAEPAHVLLLETTVRETKAAGKLRASLPTAAEYQRLALRNLFNIHSSQLQLSEEEQEAIENVYELYTEVRTTFEKAIIQRSHEPSGNLLLTIPPYVEAGNRLRELFQNDLKGVLGEQRFQLVDDYLGQYFDESFLGFGKFQQVYSVALQSRPATGPEYRIKRTLTKTAASLGSQTDPSFDGAMSTAVLSPGQISSGEYANIAEEIRRVLPPQS